MAQDKDTDQENKVVPSSFGSTVIKHSAAIHISNQVSLLQRRSWNILLANAYNDLPKDEVKQFSIPIKLLAEKLSFDSKNIGYLKDIVRALADVKVEYDILGKTGKLGQIAEEWGIEHVLVSPKIINGQLFYELPWGLREKLHNPAVYAKINLILQNVFGSKYALALYELCVDYYRVKDRRGDTGFIPLEKWRKLLGLQEGEYQRFKDFSSYVIKKSLKEINDKSDLYAEAVYKKEGRKVAFIKILIRENKNTKLDIIPPLDNAKHRQLELFPFFEVENTALLDRLLSHGVERDLAITALTHKDELQINEIIDYVDAKVESGVVRDNAGGYLASLLRGDFQKPKKSSGKAKKGPLPVKSGDVVEYQGRQYTVDDSLVLRDPDDRIVLTVGPLIDAIKKKIAKVLIINK